MAGKKKLHVIYDSNDSDEDIIANSPPTLSVCSKLSKTYADAETQTTTLFKKYFSNLYSLDPRNENFARLIAYELEYLPEEKRDYIPLVFDIIRILRGDVEVSEVMKYIPREDSTENKEPQFSIGLSPPSSPSILAGSHLLKKKIKLTYKENIVFSVDKGIQIQDNEITDAMIYRLTEDNRLTYTSEALPIVEFDNKCPLDLRNQDVARIIVFELERMSEDARSSAFSQIFNLIRIAKGDLGLHQVCSFYHKSEEKSEEIPLDILIRDDN